jgi:short-subunit dehydrogenase
MSLIGGRVLITGATGGIGQAIARAFGRHGAELILTGRRVDVLEPLAAELGARALPCDLSDRASVARLAAESGAVDVLVANAATVGTGHVLELTQAQIDTMLEVNLHAPIALARALMPGMIDRRRGHLVFISSLNGRAATPLTSVYCAAKFGLRGFALALREDLRADHVGVSIVSPGFVSEAGMFADSGVRLPPGAGTRSPQQVAEATVSAVERNRAEVSVAPTMLRLATTFASLAPSPAAWFARLSGSERVAAELACKQVGKRPDA